MSNAVLYNFYNLLCANMAKRTGKAGRIPEGRSDVLRTHELVTDS